MSAVTPRRSARIARVHTPKMSERKKGLFQLEDESSRESFTQHRKLPVVDSESDGDDCDLGIISTLDTSSSDEQQDENMPRTPNNKPWHQTRRILKESNDLKNFIKSPFTLNKYQNKHTTSDLLSSPLSTPSSPHLRYQKEMLKTPPTSNENHPSPPKLSHSRRPLLEIAESPESNDSDKCQKRLREESLEPGPNPKNPRLELMTSAPKARLSLFSTERLKEMLSTKSFYGKTNPEINTNIAQKIATAIVTTTQSQSQKRVYTRPQRPRSRRPGQINMGVRHRIRKPKIKNAVSLNKSRGSNSGNELNRSVSNISLNNTASSNNTSQEIDDKVDPFDKEKQTIDALLCQWTEEDVPEKEMVYTKQLPCFSEKVIQETSQIFQPVTIVPVNGTDSLLPQSEVLLELGTKCQDVVMTEVPKPVLMDGGYIVVEEPVAGQEELPDLDAIEQELRMLDEQIQKLAQNNNMDAAAVIASTEAGLGQNEVTEGTTEQKKSEKLFPIFSNPNTGANTSTNKNTTEYKKPLLKSSANQYVIDAGQKQFGAIQCNECGVIYQVGDPQDEHDHLIHHNATDVLRFNGWKDETICRTWDSGRCIRVRGTESGWKRVNLVLDRLVHPQLGQLGLPKPAYNYTAYLYIEKKQIVGCLIVEPKCKAFKLIPGNPDCCSVEDYPVKFGVCRIWTHSNHRRSGIATKMLECARSSCLYGTMVQRQDIAFSAPTDAGKTFAAKYCGTNQFYVYLD